MKSFDIFCKFPIGGTILFRLFQVPSLCQKYGPIFCGNNQTSILQEPFEEMTREEMKHLRRISKHCYLLSELFQHVKTQYEKKKTIKGIHDPVTNQVWPDALVNSIWKDYQLNVDPHASLTGPEITFDEKNVHLLFVPTGSHPPFWHLQVDIKQPATNTHRIIDLLTKKMSHSIPASY